jgi:uncharacterized protein (TIGR01777 family)
VRFLLAGASGFLGSALKRRWVGAGHDVSALVRREASSANEHHWDPYRGELDPSLVEEADVVVNMSGAPISHWPWTSGYRRTLLESRTVTTRVLAEAIARAEHRPVLLNQSGITHYGDCGDAELDEDSPPGGTALAGITTQWEAATAPAADAGARVCVMRTAPVLDGTGGMLSLVRWPFRLGLGGRLGNGRQWFPSLSLHDFVAAADWLASHDDCTGPYNLCAPEPVRNSEFTRALSTRLHRPAVIPVPAVALRTVLGDGLSTELVGSFRARPRRLLESGFHFRHPTIGDQIAAAFP